MFATPAATETSTSQIVAFQCNLNSLSSFVEVPGHVLNASVATYAVRTGISWNYLVNKVKPFVQKNERKILVYTDIYEHIIFKD